MKTISGKNSITLFLALSALMFVALACGKTTPPPQQYVGAWTGGDGTTLAIRADGSGDYKSGNSSVTNGSVTVDESAKTLKISMAGMGPTYKIEKAPTDTEMTLDGVVFKKGR